MIKIILTACLFSIGWYIVSNSKDKLHLDLNDSSYLKKIDDNFRKGSIGSFIGAKQKKITYYTNKVNRSKGSVVFINGRGDSFQKYPELIYNFNSQNYSFYTYDHRGQGFSDRLIQKNPMPGYIDSFENYIKDLNTFIKTVVVADRPQKIYLIGHSMGGLIATIYLQKSNEPIIPDALILVSPLFNFEKNRHNFIKIPACANDPFEYVHGKGPYNPSLKFENNHFTSSPSRFKYMRSQMESVPNITVGDATNRWVCETIQAQEKLRNTLALPENLKVLVITSNNDLTSKIEEQTDFCTKTQNCHQSSYDGKHELLMETDLVRSKVLHEIFQFIE